MAGANFSEGNNGTYEANPDTIEDILKCFLVATDCDLFKSVLTRTQANELGSYVQSKRNPEHLSIRRAGSMALLMLRISGFHGSSYAKEFGSMALLMKYKELRVPWLSLC